MCLKKAKKFREYEKQYKKQVGRGQIKKNKETILERILKEYKKK